jgi:hypothetical protein
VGWTGNPRTHGRDLEQPGNAMIEQIRKHHAAFVAIGSNLTTSILGFEDREAAWMGWVDFPRYPQVIAGLDVGLVPLADSRFNRCKSWLKGIEYASLGVPFVASPLPEYLRLAGEGAGEQAIGRHQPAGGRAQGRPTSEGGGRRGRTFPTCRRRQPADCGRRAAISQLGQGGSARLGPAEARRVHPLPPGQLFHCAPVCPSSTWFLICSTRFLLGSAWLRLCPTGRAGSAP